MPSEPTAFQLVQSPHPEAWDAYVRGHADGTIYHLSGVAAVIHKTYGHDVYRLGAVPSPGGALAGVLPLVHIRHPFFGNSLVSMPYFDTGGVLADSETAKQFLLQQAVHLAHQVGAREIELRQRVDRCDPAASMHANDGKLKTSTRSHKVRMVLDLPGQAAHLLQSFKSKLRSQIGKTQRDGLAARVGGGELLNDFYSVFATNMRDLGSPVHAKAFIAGFFSCFAKQARVVVVYRNGRPLSGSLVAKYGDTLANPWASSLRAYNRLNPNMLLYWVMLEHACNEGCRYFDFGRSTPGEGTFKFKEQWGARPHALHWHYIAVAGNTPKPGDLRRSWPMLLAERLWMRLPVGLTQIMGPPIRKYISL
jgi:FemAB-related protein (PEP-CTERM system-associated)